MNTRGPDIGTDLFVDLAMSIRKRVWSRVGKDRLKVEGDAIKCFDSRKGLIESLRGYGRYWTGLSRMWREESGRKETERFQSERISQQPLDHFLNSTLVGCSTRKRYSLVSLRRREVVKVESRKHSLLARIRNCRNTPQI